MEDRTRPWITSNLTRSPLIYVWRVGLLLTTAVVIAWLLWLGARNLPDEDAQRDGSVSPSSGPPAVASADSARGPIAEVMPTVETQSQRHEPSTTELGTPTARNVVAAAAASRPPPDTERPGSVYFPETGHYLSSFKAFWEAAGGIVVFGPPLTEEFQEPDRSTGHLLTVQYFASQRLEIHPEFAGTPYEVQLGLLGIEDAQRRQLLETEPFQPLPADAELRSDCIFFPDTGHQLCGAFRSFWERYGLELGDPGLSDRESLALFGYPISEEFTSPTTGRVVQYFERARLEIQPGRSDAEVVVGWLGADALAHATQGR